MRTCTICSHKDRKKIEAAIARGESLRSIALQFGTSHTTIKRHEGCIVETLEKVNVRKELGTIATVREVMETLSWQMRADITDLFGDDGSFDVEEIRAKGLGKMLKSLTFKREAHGTKIVDVVKAEAHSQQSAATALLSAYTRLEIAKQFGDAKLLSDEERVERIAAILDSARARRDRQLTDGLQA